MICSFWLPLKINCVAGDMNNIFTNSVWCGRVEYLHFTFGWVDKICQYSFICIFFHVLL